MMRVAVRSKSAELLIGWYGEDRWVALGRLGRDCDGVYSKLNLIHR